MTVYTDGNERKHTTDLLKFRWDAMTEKEFNDHSDNYNYTEDAIENGWIPLNVYAELQDLAPDDTVDPIYPDLDRYVRLAYEYADTDPVKLHPLAKCIYQNFPRRPQPNVSFGRG